VFAELFDVAIPAGADASNTRIQVTVCVYVCMCVCVCKRARVWRKVGAYMAQLLAHAYALRWSRWASESNELKCMTLFSWPQVWDHGKLSSDCVGGMSFSIAEITRLGDDALLAVCTLTKHELHIRSSPNLGTNSVMQLYRGDLSGWFSLLSESDGRFGNSPANGSGAGGIGGVVHDDGGDGGDDEPDMRNRFAKVASASPRPAPSMAESGWFVYVCLYVCIGKCMYVPMSMHC